MKFWNYTVSWIREASLILYMFMLLYLYTDSFRWRALHPFYTASDGYWDTIYFDELLTSSNVILLFYGALWSNLYNSVRVTFVNNERQQDIGSWKVCYGKHKIVDDWCSYSPENNKHDYYIKDNIWLRGFSKECKHDGGGTNQVPTNHCCSPLLALAKTSYIILAHYINPFILPVLTLRDKVCF